jgi:hypothetical protein
MGRISAHTPTRLARPSRSRRGASDDLPGHARTNFRRALERGNLLVAEATAKEIGRLSLDEALELTLLIARKDPRRHPRVAARWLRRYLDESLDVTIDEAAMVAASLAALTGRGGETAAEALRAVAAQTERERSRATAQPPGRPPARDGSH